MGVLLGIVLFGLSAAALLRLIGRFHRDWKAAEIVRGPAVPEQTIPFPVSGELSLFLEGPRFYTYQKRLQYSLRQATTGSGVPITPVFGGAGVRSMKHSRVERGRFSLHVPGEYCLQIGGLGPRDAGNYAVVFMRPFTSRLLRFILTCVLLGFVLIGSLVLAILSAVL
jgi:hypothetical protein